MTIEEVRKILESSCLSGDYDYYTHRGIKINLIEDQDKQ